jgi:hypothetical protein
VHEGVRPTFWRGRLLLHLRLLPGSFQSHIRMRMWRMQLPRHCCNTATSTTLTQRHRCLCKAVSMPQCVKRSAKQFHRSTYSYTSLPSPSALSTEHIGQRVTFGLHEVARTFAPGNQLIQAYRICPGILAITVAYPDRASKSSLQDVYQAHDKVQLDQTKMYTICCKHLDTVLLLRDTAPVFSVEFWL